MGQSLKKNYRTIVNFITYAYVVHEKGSCRKMCTV